MDLKTSRTWAEVNLSALSDNVRVLRSLIPKSCRLLCPVKADAYGHGAIAVSRKLAEIGVDYLAVACLSEAIILREASIHLPILILGYTSPNFTKQLLSYQLTQSVGDLRYARSLSQESQRIGGCLSVHLTLDTGMTRLGFLCDDEHLNSTLADISELYSLPYLQWEGIFTHFACADSDEKATRMQLSKFNRVLNELSERGIYFSLRHAAASAASILYPESHFDMVRPGISLYGYPPSPHCPDCISHALHPLLTLKTRVISVREVLPGCAVSYGGTFVTSRPSRIATLAAGYADGLLRSGSNRLEVWLGNKRVPLVGNICMDLCMADVTDAPIVQVGDIAEIYGEHFSIANAANASGSIVYSLLTSIGSRVPRIYSDGERKNAL